MGSPAKENVKCQCFKIRYVLSIIAILLGKRDTSIKTRTCTENGSLEKEDNTKGHKNRGY